MSAFLSWLQSLFGRFRPSPRTVGDPTSSNRASSFHLWWDVTTREKLIGASVILEIIEEPQVPRLHFWALQASFADPGGGGAHLGLQFHPEYPASRAVNWGGYAPAAEGGQLQGSVSLLPSTLRNDNTRDFPWQGGRTYRLVIARSSTPAPREGFQAWSGAVIDLESGERTHVRDLYSRGRYLTAPVVWTESFARCDHPSVAVRWSDLTVVAEDGGTSVIDAVSANYQTKQAGGCDNTNATVDDVGWVQRTNTERTAAPGSTLARETTAEGPVA